MEAMERLVGECLGRGGNAIIALRSDQSEVSCYSWGGERGYRAGFNSFGIGWCVLTDLCLWDCGDRGED